MRGFIGFCGTALIMAAGLMAGAGAASAEVPPCSGPVSKSTLYSDLGRLESVIVGDSGRLYVSLTPTGATTSRLISIRRPGGSPQTVVDGPGGPGGLAWQKKRLLWGYGNSAANGVTGDEDPVSGLYRVNLSKRKRLLVSDRLGMANGIVRARTGSIFASNDFGMKLDRITPSGGTVNGWTTLDSANGMVLSENQKYLFAAQTFSDPPAIARIRISNPPKVKTWASTEDVFTGNPVFDGLTRDNKGSLYVTAFATGEVWKIDSDRRFCVLATGLAQTSAVAFGRGKQGFSSRRLYAVGFNGELTAIKGARRAVFPEN